MNATTLQAASAPAAVMQSSSGAESNISVGPRTVRLYLAVAFLLGVLRTSSIWLVGALPVGEILLMGIVAHAGFWVLLTRRLPAHFPSFRLLMVFLTCQSIAWCAYIVSDLWWQSTMNDMIRGWLRMGFLLMDIWTLALMFGVSPHTFLAIQIGTCFSWVQAFVERPLFGDYWKFGFGYPATIAAILAGSRFFGWQGGCAALLIMGVVHSLMDYRSLGASGVLVCALLSLRMLKPSTRKAVLIGGAITALTVFPILSAKLGQQTEGRSNRSNIERLSMLQAAWEGFTNHPFIGNGSWFSKSDVVENFLLIRAERALLTGGAAGFNNEDAGGLAIHSQILVGLAEGGIFGAAFFVVYGIGILWALWYCLTDAPWHWLIPISVFVLLTSFFDLLMSPFSGWVRINIATVAALILSLAAQAKSRSREPYVHD